MIIFAQTSIEYGIQFAFLSLSLLSPGLQLLGLARARPIAVLALSAQQRRSSAVACQSETGALAGRFEAERAFKRSYGGVRAALEQSAATVTVAASTAEATVVTSAVSAGEAADIEIY